MYIIGGMDFGYFGMKAFLVDYVIHSFGNKGSVAGAPTLVFFELFFNNFIGVLAIVKDEGKPLDEGID